MRHQFCKSAVSFLGLSLLGVAGFLSGCSAGSNTKPATPAPDLSGLWLGKAIQSLSPSDPMAKRKPGTEDDIPYTPWALARLKAERPATGPNQTFENTNDPALRYADPDGYPRASIHPMRFKIVQTPDYVYQMWEYNKSWRQIALNKQPLGGSGSIVVWGISGQMGRGHAGGGFGGFKDSTWLDPVGHPHSEDLHMIERIRRTDPETLVFDFTFDDPKAYTKPWRLTTHVQVKERWDHDRDDLHDLR